MNDKLEKLFSNCESCVTKPCQTGCPLNNDITEFIRNIKKDNIKGAYEVLSKTTVLSPLCGRICPHSRQCQGKCVKGVSYEAVHIGELETFVGDEALKNGWTIDVPKETKYNVAVVGSGPSGLTCAAFLRKMGIGVTLFEKHDYLGGLLMHGIPAFRLPKDIVKNVTDNIVNMGIKVEYNKELCKNLFLEDLEKEYDAIFLGIGANNANQMRIPGEELPGVYGGNNILEEGNNLDYEGKTIMISGAGNVAMDVSRSAIKKGAKEVVIVYRSSEDDITADPKEVEEAKEDGVKFIFLTTISEILGTDKVTGIKVLDNELKEEGGKLKPTPIEGTEHTINCDYVIMAIGSHPEDYVNDLKLDKNERGRIQIDKFGRTSNEKVFSGGDVAGSNGTVAWAARAGRDAAYAIKAYLESK